jgi:hypothetical protein
MRFLCAVVLALLIPAAASATPERASTPDCFLSSTWQGWSAPRDADVLYLRVRGNNIFRVDLTPGSHVHRYGGDYLVNQIRGSSWICSALDLDLALTNYDGFPRPLVATNLHKLTPAEVAAIPREDMPY